MNIWLVQYLCPQRHAIMAMPYNRDALPPTDIEDVARTVMADHKFDPWCAICRSPDLHFEHVQMPYTDWADAVAACKIVELQNILSRLEIERQRENTN